MSKLKQACRFLFSMKFAIILLSALLLVCFIGSFLPQNQASSYYTTSYSEKLGLIILILGFNDTFHSPLFLALSGFLTLNLLGCNLIHFPALIKNWKTGFTADNMIRYSLSRNEPVCRTEKPEEVIKAAHFRSLTNGVTAQKRRYIYSVRNKIGLTGAWLTHLGLLVIIAGFTLGQIGSVTYTVYGVPGEIKHVGNTVYALAIDSFDIGLREDETVEQYTSNLTMMNIETGVTQSGSVSVNHPLKLFGMKLYQNSTGWAAEVCVYKGQDLIQSQVLCAGETIAVKDFEDLMISFNAFYPDFVYSNGRPATKSSSLNNPGYLYSAYYQGNLIGMNILVDGDYITIDDYTVIFDYPENYTLIQLKNDPFTVIPLIGGIIMCFALIFAFYTNTEEILAVETTGSSWDIFVKSKKSELLLTERIMDIVSTDVSPGV